MTLACVPIHRTSPTQTVLVEHGATVGATFGVNLRWPDGRLVQAGDFTTPATGGGTGPDTTDALDEGNTPTHVGKAARRRPVPRAHGGVAGRRAAAHGYRVGR